MGLDGQHQIAKANPSAHKPACRLSPKRAVAIHMIHEYFVTNTYVDYHHCNLFAVATLRF